MKAISSDLLVIQNWLRQSARREAFAQAFSALFFAAAGGIILMLCCAGLCLLAVFLGLRVGISSPQARGSIPLIHSAILVCMCLATVALSFVGAYKNRFGMDYSGLKVRMMASLDGSAFRAVANMVCDAWFSGPRLFFVALECGGKSKRLRNLPISELAIVLAWLLRRGRKATIAEMVAALPRMNVVRVVPLLRDIPGVIWLPSAPGTILLSTDLRGVLLGMLAEMPPQAELEEEPTSDTEEALPPLTAEVEEAVAWYAVLDLPAFAALREVKRKYRELAKLYHPDLSPGCEDKMREINHAYHSILDRARMA